MHSTTILSALLAGVSLVSAAAMPRVPILPRNGNFTPDDVILYGADGRMELMSKSEWESLTSPGSKAFNLTTSQPIPLNTNGSTVSNNTARSINKRCDSKEIYTMYPVQTFLGWDVAMSQVVNSNGVSTTIAVAEGYSISNSVSVGTSFASSLEGFLTTTLSIDFTETWTSTYTTTLTYSVPVGKYGAIVSNPLTTRYSGRVDKGCVGSPTESSEFQADSYSSKSYGGLSWVDGVISLCLGDSIPLQRCTGDGSL